MPRLRFHWKRIFHENLSLILIVACWALIFFQARTQDCINKIPIDKDLAFYSHLLIVSDPQIQSTFSYDYSLYEYIRPFVEYYCDTYMRRYFANFQSALDFEKVLFLGDLFDGVTAIMLKKENRYDWTQSEYEILMKRFHHIFPKKILSSNNYEISKKETQRQKQQKFLYVAGNHDIGWRVSRKENWGEELVYNFENNFGSLHYKEDLGEDVELVVIASSAIYQEGSPTVKLHKEFVNFLSKMNQTKGNNRILFSHVPLYRQRELQSGTDCVPNSNGFSHCYFLWVLHQTLSSLFVSVSLNISLIPNSYFTMIDQSTSKMIKQYIGPMYIFSGDNHEYCTTMDSDGVGETTVSTFSWMQGILNPGTSIVSIERKQDTTNIIITSCTFHSQIYVYISYLILLFLTVIVLFILFVKRLVATNSMRASIHFAGKLLMRIVISNLSIYLLLQLF